MSEEPESYPTAYATGINLDELVVIDKAQKKEKRRAKFAGMAMQGLLARGATNTTVVSELAVKYADALIAELEKEQS